MTDELRLLFYVRVLLLEKFPFNLCWWVISYKRSGALPRKPSAILMCSAISYAAVC